MYRYDEFDHAFVAERVEQFRGQVARRVAGELTEDEFKPLRLMNGLYLQLHAYMLRVAIPYGTLSAKQMRKLAHIARAYDRGYGHFTTRQNIQYNWPRLEDMPAILNELASVEMHAIQTSGNCIHNATADPLAGVAADEIDDPRVYAEIIRQRSTLHPEFSFLPRKFKIAVTGSPNDRAVTRGHDIGLRMHWDLAGNPGFKVMVGGGQGRTPIMAKTIRNFLPVYHLFSYLEAVLRVYNQLGRCDNIYKARIKILVQSEGTDTFAQMVEAEWQAIKDNALDLPKEEQDRIKAYFGPPGYDDLAGDCPELNLALDLSLAANPRFAAWVEAMSNSEDYAGDIDVNEAWDRLWNDPDSVLIDVRTKPEWNYVGLPDLSTVNREVLCCEWQVFPAMDRNADFAAEIEQAGIAKDAPIFLLCRSGVRSKHAAILLTSQGYQRCYNVAGGFEGDKDESGHRGKTGGWKFAGLPWKQG